MNSPFAKLYGPEDDQILVTLMDAPEDPENPEVQALVRVAFDPKIEGLTISSTTTSFATPEVAREAFGTLTEDTARAAVNSLRLMLQEALGDSIYDGEEEGKSDVAL